jgi:hypothetical protein
MATRNRKQKKGTRKRKLSPWIVFVQKVRKENPKMDFGQVLKLASSLKKKGAMK